MVSDSLLAGTLNLFLLDFLDRNLTIVVAESAQIASESVPTLLPSAQFRCLRGSGAECFASASALPRLIEGALKHAVYAVVLAKLHGLTPWTILEKAASLAR